MNFFSLFKRKILYKFKKKINIDNDAINSNNLDELFHYYGSDKADIFKATKEKGHGFSKFYSNKLNFLRNKDINILEIGSYSGASAAAFKKYFKNSKIYCFDINISNFKYSSKDLNVFGLDINDKKKIDKTLKEISTTQEYFDLIIDDGSHNLSDILFGLKYLFKHLKKKGIYIIEDFKHPNYYDYNKNINHILVDQLLDNLKNKNFFESNLFNKTEQNYFFEKIKKIEIFKGSLKDSDISFIEKN
ncbi:class I SAM-dependent methyltransferase [Candidatus Pelagibacter bacterium]|nr:class I SAM-dependent methyltransferase [Candidatus Pelagibacter bacterium]